MPDCGFFSTSPHFYSYIGPAEYELNHRETICFEFMLSSALKKPRAISRQAEVLLMKKLIVIAVLYAAIVLPCSASAAGLCCQVSSGVQETVLGAASPEANRFSLQTTYSFTRMDKIKEGTADRSAEDVMNAGKYTNIPITMDMAKYTLTAAYGFSREFAAFVSIPYIRNTMDMTHLHGDGEWEGHTMDPVSGIGDITVMGLYRPYVRSENGITDTISIGAGVKTPSGSSTVKTSGGSYVHAHMQPGTGSWDPIVSVIYSRSMNPFVLQADATYQASTRNSGGYEFGDSLSANLSGKYIAVPNLNIAGGLTYLHVDRANDRDGKYTNLASLMDDPANTGGDSLWFSPGLQLLPFENSLIDLKVQLPVWERVSGIQLVSGYRVLLGFSYSF